MLQYITSTSSPVPVTEQVRQVLEGGCRWIQVRMKDASDEEIAGVIEEIKPMCLDKEAFLILNDRVELAKTLDVGGVHLGKTDMLPSQARLILGPAAVIGVTANTVEDVEAVKALDIDYIGIGPYRFTEAKKNLAPTLGIEGIGSICGNMHEREINIATVAVGGILPEDVAPLMESGVNGIAVSGAIAFAPDIKAATEEFLRLLEPYEKK